MLEGRVAFHEVSGDMSLLSPAPEASYILVAWSFFHLQVTHRCLTFRSPSSLSSYGDTASHLPVTGLSLVKTVALCEETCFYLKSGCGHLRDHWKTYCAGVFISCSLLSDLLHTPPLFHVLPSAEAEVFAFWLLVRDVSSFSGCHFFSFFGTIGDDFRQFWFAGRDFRCFLLSFDASLTEGLQWEHVPPEF